MDTFRLALSHVFFEARVRGYASLDFAVEIAGARDLAGLLDNNLDLFLMLMRAYIPDTFRSVTNVYGGEDAMTFDISASPELREAFEGALRAARSRFRKPWAGGSSPSGHHERDTARWRAVMPLVHVVPVPFLG